MRRKDLLIIIAIIVAVAFVAVLGIYYVVNDGDIFPKIKQEIAEIVENKENYYSNGWEKATVAEIRHDIPIPVGFTYVEGDKNSGLIIKNDNTNEEYMWIPYVEDAGSYMDIELNLKGNTEETKGSILEYNGFYIAIESAEEKYDRYLRENTSDMEKYAELKKLGYEAYKKAYEEQVGEEFNLNTISEEEIEKLELTNGSKTEVAETHLITVEEMALLNKFEEARGETIFVKDYKALTLSASSVDTDNKLTKEDLIEKAEKYEKIIDDAIAYIAEERDIREARIIEKIDEETDDKYSQEFTNPDKLEEMDVSEINDLIEYVYSTAEDVIIENYCENEEEKEKIKEIFKNTEETEDPKQEEVDPSKWDSNIVAKTQDGVPIPQGFVYKKGTVETGLVIEQEGSENLRFIWIPVEDVNAVKGTFKANAEAAKVEELETNSYAEYKDEAGDEYNALVDSINLYGGFYISEAELGYDVNGDSINVYRQMKQTNYEEFNRVTNGDYYRNLNDGNKEGLFTDEKDFKLTYESAKEKCKKLYSISESVVSHLTYGLEYDATVNYLIEKGLDSKKAFSDSREIGKYVDTLSQTERTASGVWDEKYLNGIYGLAGNLAEVTQEKDGDKIIVRSGSWKVAGNVQQLASKFPMTEEEIKEDIETIGFRACLYLKTEYEDISGDLEKAKTDAKTYFNNQLNNITVYKGEDKGTNYFDVNSIVVKGITNWVNSKIDQAKTSVALREIANEGIWPARQIAEATNNIVNYPQGLAGYTYGETENDCWTIKTAAVEEIKALTWKEDGTFTNSSGQTVVLNDDIVIKSHDDIGEVREAYRTKVITEQIDNYPTAADKDYTKTIKTNAKEKEMNTTQDFANLPTTIAQKWQGIIEVAYEFDEYCPSGTKYEAVEKEYLDKIANTTTVEDAKKIAEDGKAEIDKIKEEPETEPTTPTEPTEPTKPSDFIGSDDLITKLKDMQSKGQIASWGYEGKTAYLVLKADNGPDGGDIFKKRDERTFYYIGGDYLFMAKSPILDKVKWGTASGEDGNKGYTENVKKNIRKRNALIQEYIGGLNIQVRNPIYKDLEKIANNGLYGLKWVEPGTWCWYDMENNAGGAGFEIKNSNNLNEWVHRTAEEKTEWNYRPVIDLDTSKGDSDYNTGAPVSKRATLDAEIDTIWKKGVRDKENELAHNVLSKVKDDSLKDFEWYNNKTDTYDYNYVAFKINGKVFVQMKDGDNQSYPYFISYSKFNTGKKGFDSANDYANRYAANIFDNVSSTLPYKSDYTSFTDGSTVGRTYTEWFNSHISSLLYHWLETCWHAEWVIQDDGDDENHIAFKKKDGDIMDTQVTWKDNEDRALDFRIKLKF